MTDVAQNLRHVETNTLLLLHHLVHMSRAEGAKEGHVLRAGVVEMRVCVDRLWGTMVRLEDAVNDLTAELQRSVDAVKERNDGGK